MAAFLLSLQESMLLDEMIHHAHLLVQELRQDEKAGYRPDQPRVPAGSADGGQWTSDESGMGGNARRIDTLSPHETKLPYDPPIEPVYPIENLLLGLSGGQALSFLRLVLSAWRVSPEVQIENNQNFDHIVQQIEDYFGGVPERIFRNKSGDLILIKGDRMIRFNIENPHGHDPHFHMMHEESIGSGKWIDSGKQHMYYFRLPQ